MAEFIPINFTVEAEIRMLLDGQRIENTLYFQFPEGFGTPDIVALGNGLLTWWDVNYSENVCSTVVLREIYLTDLTSATSPTVTIPAPAPAPTGVFGDDGVPSNAALCISFRTDARGRSSRGRNYISGLSNTEVTTNTVASTRIAALKATYEVLFDVAEGATCTWVVASRFTGGVPRTTGLVRPVTAVVVTDNTIDSQRRRLPGRGR